MKVLHIAPTYYPATYWGGPIFSVYALNNALAGLPGITLKVLTTDAAGPRLGDRTDISNLTGLYSNQDVIITRRIAGSSISLELMQKLPGLVKWADVVHLTATYSFPTIPTLVLCRIFSKPLVWSPRGALQDVYEWEGSRRRRLKRFWDRICNALILRDKVVTHTTSKRERVATQERIPSATAMIVPNGVDVPDFLPERNWLPDGRLRLMYLGRLSPKKGIENLLHAMDIIDDPTVSLTIFGEGDIAYSASLNELAARLGLLGKSVFFAGKVNGESKTAAFYNADVCVVPSHTENFCMVVAEALAHGLPVVASHGTPWAEIEENRCGLWVDNNPASLAKAIVQIRALELPKLGSSGRAWMIREFSWSPIAEEMMEIYRSLVSRSTLKEFYDS
jgi:glycosyltransferase involved in cell wall biosynthesis